MTTASVGCLDGEQAIRDALAAGPTPGPWDALPEEDDRHYLRIRGGRLGCRFKIAAVHKPKLIPEVQEREDRESQANARLIAACNPETMRALLAELDRLRSTSRQEGWQLVPVEPTPAMVAAAPHQSQEAQGDSK